jgi:putative nucleotidyltransferase with HDIG domain
MPALKNIFARFASLPAIPALLMEALQQINGKQDLTMLVDKISQDPSMTIKILRIVNSPFYGMSREIGSLREAIVLLGLNRLRDMFISICFSKMLPVWHKDFNYNKLWHHSMAVAECSRHLAKYTDISPDLAFTAGLLHDIGRLVIVVLFPDEFSQIIQESKSSLPEIEQRILGFDNVQIGGMAAKHWNFPVAIQEAIEQHDTPPAPGATKSLGLLIYTANLLILNADQADESVLEEHEPICTALALLNVSIDLAAKCSLSGRQFADQIITLS